MALKLLPILSESELLALPKESQDAYLRRAYRYLWNDRCESMEQLTRRQAAPTWLWFVSLAYVEGNVGEITGTPNMSLYRQILRNQFTNSNHVQKS